MFSQLNKDINNELQVHGKAHKSVAMQKLMHYGSIHYPLYITNLASAFDQLCTTQSVNMQSVKCSCKRLPLQPLTDVAYRKETADPTIAFHKVQHHAKNNAPTYSFVFLPIIVHGEGSSRAPMLTSISSTVQCSVQYPKTHLLLKTYCIIY